MYWNLELSDLINLAEERLESFKNGDSSIVDHAHKNAKEAKNAMEKMAQLVEVEKERIAKLAEEGNKQLSPKLIEKEVNVVCPVCLEDIPPILQFEMKEKEPQMMICCGKFVCMECFTDLSKQAKAQTSKKVTCPCCRGNAYFESRDQLGSKASKNQKPWLLYNLALAYQTGTSGMPFNITKSITLLNKAAEWGDARAQTALANIFYQGIGNILPRPSTSQKWAERGVEQGEENAQALLAVIVAPHDADREYDLNSLAAFQGNFQGRFNLGNIYYQRGKREEENCGDKDSILQNYLLSMYWFGKAAEIEHEYKGTCQALVQVVQILHVKVMSEWHESIIINVEPLPGYSHVPFCVWALRKAGTCYPVANTALKSYFDVWNMICANCGSRARDQLKVCARCKALSYCSKECQVAHWKKGHKVDCKKHWVESFFPNIRTPHRVITQKEDFDLLKTIGELDEKTHRKICRG